MDRLRSRYVGTIAELDRMDLSDAGNWREELGGCMEDYQETAGEKTLSEVIKENLVSIVWGLVEYWVQRRWHSMCYRMDREVWILG